MAGRLLDADNKQQEDHRDPQVFIPGQLKMKEYEVAKAALTADFINEYELSVLVEKADRPPR